MMFKVRGKNTPTSYYSRRQRKDLVFLKWTVIIFCFILAFIFLLKFVFTSDFFKVKKIEVVNLPHFFEKDNFLFYLQNKLLENKWKALIGKEHILFWLGRVSEISSLPFIKEVNKETNIWNKTVKISLTLREPEGVICEKEGNCYFFDKEGKVFLKAPQTEGPLFLKINDKTGRKIVLGQYVFPKKEWLSNFYSIVSVMKNNGFKIAESGVEDFQKEEWYLKITEGTIFLFNFNFVPERFEYILENLSNKINFKNTVYVDFRVENRIYYK